MKIGYYAFVIAFLLNSLLQKNSPGNLVIYFLVAAVIEEISKISMYQISKKKISLIWVALGYAVSENLMYYYYYGYILRRIFPTLLHLSLAYLYLRLKTRYKIFIIIIIHFTWNYLVMVIL